MILLSGNKNERLLISHNFINLFLHLNYRNLKRLERHKAKLENKDRTALIKKQSLKTMCQKWLQKTIAK